MSIESNPRPPETNPFSATPAEIDAREALFAPDIDYTQGTSDHVETPSSQPAGTEIIDVPLLEPDNGEISQRLFEDNLMKPHELPQLEPAPREPRHRL